MTQTFNDALRHKIDKEEKIKAFGEGPWLDEPDYHEFTHKGLKCIVKRSHLGNLCGYVQVPEDHKHYKDEKYLSFPYEVHGGITFSGEFDREWLIGFDCAHSSDTVPALQALYEINPLSEVVKELKKLRKLEEFNGIFDSTYKTFDYVKSECIKLAEQVLEENNDEFY